MDPQQELFTALLVALRGKGYDVYDGFLPPEGTPYPFIYMADAQELDASTKNAIHHNNVRERGTVSAIMLDIKHTARTLASTQGYEWFQPTNSVNQRILPDNTTAQPLLHGILELTFRFS